ncbi:MAG TPA: PRC-barrel domain-containing protein [Verrucomicrobiae bacterium]|nr:PRC-barrel domain-containing protein [Verrucomicrobiae bacterium]
MKSKRLEQMAVYVAAALCAQVLIAADQTDQTQSQQPGQTRDSASQTTGAPGDIRVSKLKGADVKSKSGEDLGKLEDLVLDRRTGQIAFAIIGKGRLLGLGEKPHVVPWQEATIDSEKQVTLNIDKQKMQSGPTVSSDYSELNNPDAVLVIYKFYEVQPAGGPGTTPGGTQEGSGTSKSGQPNSGSSNP